MEMRGAEARPHFSLRANSPCAGSHRPPMRATVASHTNAFVCRGAVRDPRQAEALDDPRPWVARDPGRPEALWDQGPTRGLPNYRRRSEPWGHGWGHRRWPSFKANCVVYFRRRCSLGGGCHRCAYRGAQGRRNACSCHRQVRAHRARAQMGDGQREQDTLDDPRPWAIRGPGRPGTLNDSRPCTVRDPG
eukprot:9470873-Pyramimonas_sp.AAC.2